MIPPYLMPLANHLWQSSLFVMVVGLTALALRRHHASLRYWLWLAASVKFLIPFSMLAGLGGLLASHSAPAIAPAQVPLVIREIGQPFAHPDSSPFLTGVPEGTSPIPPLLFAVWLCGFAISASVWFRAWLRVRSSVRAASPIQPSPFDRCPVLLTQSPELLEPCVFGIFRPVLLLPDGIRERITPEQLNSILCHEICHVRRRDNLTAAIHLLVETLFWFFPLVYWIGRRLMEERERACDEEVLGAVAEPAAYAEGILAVCRFGLRSPPACASGATGSNLRRRIEEIMASREALNLSGGRKILLIAGFALVLIGPVVIGLLSVRPGRAQDGAAPQTFDVASIKANRTGAQNSGFRRFTGGQLNATNITLKMLISFAYDISQDQILQGPAWVDSERYDVVAKPDRSSGASDQSMAAIRRRTQALLADRFQLSLHKETRELPIFALVVDKGGPKNLQTPKGNSPDLVSNGHHVACLAASMEFFAKAFLMGQVHKVVLDRTGIQGQFDFAMDWSPDDLPARTAGETNTAYDPSGPSLFVALREQLGLKLEPSRGPVEILIVDRAEKASDN